MYLIEFERRAQQKGIAVRIIDPTIDDDSKKVIAENTFLGDCGIELSGDADLIVLKLPLAKGDPGTHG